MAFLARPTAITDTATVSADRLLGFSIAEVAGSPAIALVRFRDKTVSGTILATVKLPASGGATVLPDTEGVLVQSGTLYIQVATGTVEGSVYTG